MQGALRAAGRLPDWKSGVNSLQCEWVENRHGVYQAALPAAWLPPGRTARLCCAGLDGNGVVLVNGRIEEYVLWRQARHARALTVAVRACRGRFPGCGGILLWMGHDSFPCMANLSIVDFWGRPKPAALAVAEGPRVLDPLQRGAVPAGDSWTPQAH